MVCNVEYNQLEDVIRNTIDPAGIMLMTADTRRSFRNRIIHSIGSLETVTSYV